MCLIEIIPDADAITQRFVYLWGWLPGYAAKNALLSALFACQPLFCEPSAQFILALLQKYKIGCLLQRCAGKQKVLFLLLGLFGLKKEEVTNLCAA